MHELNGRFRTFFDGQNPDKGFSSEGIGFEQFYDPFHPKDRSDEVTRLGSDVVYSREALPLKRTRLDPYDDELQRSISRITGNTDVEPLEGESDPIDAEYIELLPEEYLLPSFDGYIESAKLEAFKLAFFEKYHHHWNEFMHALFFCGQTMMLSDERMSEIDGVINFDEYFTLQNRYERMHDNEYSFAMQSVKSELSIEAAVEKFVHDMPNSTLDDTDPEVDLRRPSNMVFEKILKGVLSFFDRVSDDDKDDEDERIHSQDLYHGVVQEAAVLFLEYRFGFAKHDVLDIVGISDQEYFDIKGAYENYIYTNRRGNV